MCQVESRNKKIVALSELKGLRKTETQPIANFCVELERLTRRAYPELNEQALSVVRSDLLYEQLMHWDDSCKLQKVLEGQGEGMYERLKDVAMRVERRRLSQRYRLSERSKFRFQGKRKSKGTQDVTLNDAREIRRKEDTSRPGTLLRNIQRKYKVASASTVRRLGTKRGTVRNLGAATERKNQEQRR